MNDHENSPMSANRAARYEARRRALMTTIAGQCNGSQAEFARKIGLSESYVTRMLSDPGTPHHKRIGEDMADRIADAFGLIALQPVSTAPALADHDLVGPVAWRHQLPTGRAFIGGRNSQVLESLAEALNHMDRFGGSLEPLFRLKAGSAVAAANRFPNAQDIDGLPDLMEEWAHAPRGLAARSVWSRIVARINRHFTPALIKTGVTPAEISQVQRDLARLAAGGDSEVASASVRAQAVIEGLLSGLDVEQLS